MRAKLTLPIDSSHLTDLARDAGRLMRQRLIGPGMAREVKNDFTPLTVTDTEINQLVIKRVLKKATARIDIVGEEGCVREDSPWQLVCDPIDGTFPFTWGAPIATFMLALLYEGTPVLGIIYDPFTDRMFYAEKGRGATMNGAKLQVSSRLVNTDRAVVGFVSWPECPYDILAMAKHLEQRGVALVNLCSIGYMEALVAAGEFVGTIFPAHHHHDTAPGHIIVEEAGGKVSDIFGEPISYAGDRIRGHIMSNGHYHALLAEAAAKARLQK